MCLLHVLVDMDTGLSTQPADDLENLRYRAHCSPSSDRNRDDRGIVLFLGLQLPSTAEDKLASFLLPYVLRIFDVWLTDPWLLHLQHAAQAC